MAIKDKLGFALVKHFKKEVENWIQRLNTQMPDRECSNVLQDIQMHPKNVQMSTSMFKILTRCLDIGHFFIKIFISSLYFLGHFRKIEGIMVFQI